jgi:hypothetical protein
MLHTKRSYVSTGVARVVRMRERHQDGVTVPCQHNRDVLLVLGVPCQHSRNVLSALMCHLSKNRDVLSALLCHVSKTRHHVSTRCAMSAKQRRPVSARVPCQQIRNALQRSCAMPANQKRPAALDLPCQQKPSGSRNGPGGCNRKSGVVATARNVVQRKQDEREATDTQV